MSAENISCLGSKQKNGMKIKELKKYLEYADDNIDVMLLSTERYEHLLRKARAYDKVTSIVIDKGKVFQNMIDRIIEQSIEYKV